MTPDKNTPTAISSEWQPTVSGDAGLRLSSGPEAALRMDFEFKEGGGFVVAKQALERPMPEEYAVRFRLRGRSAPIQLELKLVDPSGRNVWRRVMKNLSPPLRWKSVTVESRDIEFAWGPAGAGSISQLGSIEIAIVAAAAVKGTLWIADLRIENTLPAEPPTARASSSQPDFDASQALTGAGWKPAAGDRHPWIMIDLIGRRRLGGLVIEWLDGAPASGFRVRGSNTGRRWTALHTAATAGGRRSYVYLPGAHVRFLRLELNEPAGAAVRVQSFEFSRSIDVFWHNVANAEIRGWHPRWLHREQTVWTPIGTPHGTQCALMNADGMIEVSEGSFSIEPMLLVEGRLFTWADVGSSQALEEGWMPVPSVTWETPQWRLRMRCEATDNGDLRVHYRIENTTARSLSARLFVLVRPFQVTPPWQSFRNLGGVSRIRDLSLAGHAVCVNGGVRLVAATAPSGFAASTFDEGFIAQHLAGGVLPAKATAHDPFGFASGALAFDLSLEALGSGECVIGAPLGTLGAAPGAVVGGAVPGVPVTHGAALAAIGSSPVASPPPAEDPAFDWGAHLAVTQWRGEGWAMDAVRAALTATAQILVTRSGPALQPGPRRYTRSWIRDGAMMSAALLRMGHAQAVRDFILWYAPHQRADGFVPCCVDREGTDWLVEHDSHGELVALIGDYHRFTADTDFLELAWTFVEKAVDCIERLLEPSGLLPISASHEGYLAQPVHSYWDGFWAVRGLRDAVRLARATGREDTARRWEALAARVAASLFASIEDTRARRKLDFIPGSAEWADFDPTATANALYLLDVPAELDRRAIERTFDIYLADWRGKRSGSVDWSNYTPYEIRIIGALVRLGRRDAALELLRFFLSDRRPQPWNQWPEIAWRDAKAPTHVGDLPHTWIAGEYVLAVRCLFAYEREADSTLIVAAGLASEWIDGAGVSVDKMPTLYGSLSYTLRRTDAQTLRFEIGGGVAAALVLRPPMTGRLQSVTVNGRPHTAFDDDSVTGIQGPAEVVCTAFP